MPSPNSRCIGRQQAAFIAAFCTVSSDASEQQAHHENELSVALASGQWQQQLEAVPAIKQRHEAASGALSAPASLGDAWHCRELHVWREGVLELRCVRLLVLWFI